MYSQLGFKPNLIKNSPFHKAIETEIRLRQPLSEMAMGTARNIYNAYAKGKPLKEQIQVYLDWLMTYDMLHIRTRGKTDFLKNTDKNQTITAVKLTSVFASSISVDEQDVTVLDRWQNQNAEEVRLNIASDERYHNFVGLLIQALLAQEIVREYSERHQNPAVESSLLAISKTIDLPSASAQIVEEMSRLRKYGLKNCFFQDGMLHNRSEAWVFIDSTSVYRHTRETHKFSDYDLGFRPLALVGLTNRANIKGRLEYKNSSSEHSDTRFIDMPFTMNFELNERGDLAVPNTMGMLKMDDMFRKHEAETLYEMLRFTNLLRLYDLLVPIEVVRKVPKLPSRPPGIMGMVSDMVKSPLRRLEASLIVPRLKTLEYMDPIIAQIENEAELAIQQQTEDAARRQQMRHGVVGHIRRLPEGYACSPEARQRAWDELRLELQDNETYVKPHERGKGENLDLPHKAKQR